MRKDDEWDYDLDAEFGVEDPKPRRERQERRDRHDRHDRHDRRKAVPRRGHRRGLPGRLIGVLAVLVLLAVLAFVIVGRPLLEKYSYGTELADMDDYYGVSGEYAAIILQDEKVAEQALIRDGVCYFDLGTVHTYMNEIFYADESEGLLLYTDAVGTTTAVQGESTYTDANGSTGDLGHAAWFAENGTVYVAADYVQLFTNYSYTVYDRHVQVYTEWGERQTATIRKATAVRERGGIKSPILEQLAKGDKVEILEQMDTWTKVKTADSVIGYVENKRLKDITTETETPVTDYAAPEYTGLPLGDTVCLGFHSIGGVGGNSTLSEMVSGTKGMNVIAPTWFSLTDNEGSYRSFGERSYVESAHGMGLQVWGVLDNFNYRNETGAAVDEAQVLSSTAKRQRLVSNIVADAMNLGLDGINIDFEQVSTECGEHYVQLLRELSVACRANGLVLSIDNYVPFSYNGHYRLDIQGEIADYVVIMGYDERVLGSDEAGSVASLDYVSYGLQTATAQAPAEKVINALPFYTIVWTTNGADISGEYLTMNNVDALVAQTGAEKVWDEETCQNVLEWTSSAGTKQVWLEDAESISAKLNVMTAYDLGGVAVWRLGYGTSAAWELINAYCGMQD